MPLRGIVHMAFDEKDGPLNNVNCGDRSRFNGGSLEFIHEFGHQLWLGHEAFWAEPCCPLYPSLMNYSFNYGFGDDRNKAGYLDCAFLGFTIHPLALPKHIPFPIDKLKCLAGSPYRFKLRADATGKGMYVDWNWNGLFDHFPVIACVNYSQGMYLEPRFSTAKTQTALVLVSDVDSAKPRILLIYGKAANGDSRLVMRTWMGHKRESDPTNWSAENVLEESGVLGDPTATYLRNGVTWAAYQTVKGVVLRPIMADGSGMPVRGPAALVPQTAGAQPTLAAFNGRLALLLWRGRSEPVGCKFLRASGFEITGAQEEKLDILSESPVGAVAGQESDSAELLSLHFLLGRDGLLRIAELSTVGGKYAKHRLFRGRRLRSGNLQLSEGKPAKATGANFSIGPLRNFNHPPYCALCSRMYGPPASTSSSWLPCSAMPESSTTMMRSAFWMVARR